MPATPQFSYFVSPHSEPVTADSPLWRQSLPLSRRSYGRSAENSICRGEYFCAVRSFLEGAGQEVICRALAGRLKQPVRVEDIREIRIHLEKHGEFYHPARVDVVLSRHKISFVLNVAVSDMGNRHIRDEYRSLKRLNAEFAHSFLPQVYGCGGATAGRRRIQLFVGEWFEGYHEFHLARDPLDDKNKICVWDDRNGRFFLTPELTQNLYAQAARIMAYYYNVETSEHVSLWHHASGDFVLRLDRDGLDLKLITARRYVPFFDGLRPADTVSGRVESILQTLLIFFLNLSIRMRLDRVDGVGEIAWADGIAVNGTLAGFFEGLALKSAVRSMPDSLDRCFRYYLSACTPDDLYDLSWAVLARFNPTAPEVPVAKQHLEAHAAMLSRAIRQMS